MTGRPHGLGDRTDLLEPIDGRDCRLEAYAVAPDPEPHSAVAAFDATTERCVIRGAPEGFGSFKSSR